MGCHHHLGAGAGPGPLLAAELLIFAVFSAQVRVGARLTNKDFPTKSLKRGDLSLARHAHTSWATFRDNVLTPGQRLLPIQGLAISEAGMLRGLIAELDSVVPPKRLRSVCVLDKVEAGDHDGHAALKYCSEEAALNERTERPVVRAQIQAELAATFSEVRAVSSLYSEASLEGY
jgi:hypothetical protein